MNRTDFTYLVKNPEKLGVEHIDTLKKIVSDFPYFGVAQVLLCKALLNSEHYEYNKQLKNTALSVGNRSVLFHYLNQEEVETTDNEIFASFAKSQPNELGKEAQIDLKEIVAEIEPTKELSEPETVSSLHHSVEDLSISSEKPIVQLEMVNEVTELASEFNLQDLDDEPETALEEETAINEEKKAIEVVTEFNIAEPKIIIPEQTEKPISSPIESGAKLSFLKWLEVDIHSLEAESNEFNSSEMAISLMKNEVPPQKPTIQEEKQVLLQVSEVLEDVKKVSVNEPKKELKSPEQEIKKGNLEKNNQPLKTQLPEVENILDKFIRENPSISRPKSEFFNPASVAKSSVEENNEIVSETLANIYVKQGLIKKAIFTYEKLSLIYPHKISYFAALISKLKSEHNLK